jgi:hypothetical protein
MRDINDMVERLARAIARGHGGQFKMRRDGETFTIANMQGYGGFAHDLDRYVDDRWQEYEFAARFAITVLGEPTPMMVKALEDLFVSSGQSAGAASRRSKAFNRAWNGYLVMLEAALK